MVVHRSKEDVWRERLQSQVVLETAIFRIKATVGMEFISDIQFFTLSIVGYRSTKTRATPTGSSWTSLQPSVNAFRRSPQVCKQRIIPLRSQDPKHSLIRDATPQLGNKKLIDIGDERRSNSNQPSLLRQQNHKQNFPTQMKQGVPPAVPRQAALGCSITPATGQQKLIDIDDERHSNRRRKSVRVDNIPKCVNKIQHFFNLSKETSEVCRDRREEEGAKAPMIQRLVTPIRSSAPRHLKSLIHRRTEHHKEQKG
ncbi:hypothetical protein B0H14DRAFT_3477591 [Mycena olivaceomarginata]|nr:hypothetical protein B0H14DRAFT_3477591 [Mycena olivaceomarginata]